MFGVCLASEQLEIYHIRIRQNAWLFQFWFCSARQLRKLK